MSGDRLELLFSIAFALLCAGVFMVWLMNSQDQPQPPNLPTLADVRQYLLDCEQFNPGKRCVVVAMPVPDFSDRGSE